MDSNFNETEMTMGASCCMEVAGAESMIAGMEPPTVGAGLMSEEESGD